jgi:hypothetical protein
LPFFKRIKVKSCIRIKHSESLKFSYCVVQIQPDTAYQKQQETLIVWSEGDNFDLALSFQVGLDPGLSRAGCERGRDLV